MGAVRGSTSCVNHPGIEAVARCKQCGKPVCGICVVAGATGQFCSEECREKHQEFVKRAQQLDLKKSRSVGLVHRLTRWVGKLVVLALLLLFVAALVTFFTDIRIPVIGDMIRGFMK
ncbi:MAG TPA: hypothetical protein PLO37_24190 [Candidatus Hydrogenedentes bacterium]|nr:hypothetical protein [Candidatus Hydrogenedentota bacterium]HPG69964.1 hypothetical protein [Candidatus Hydrogenedentota bacterium]